MKIRTLIVNGSPRPKGDTAFLINELKKHLHCEITEISAYRSNITPCLDCRQCLKTGFCSIKDEMDTILADDFDNVILATPVYYGTLPGPVLSLMSRFQLFRSPKNSQKMHRKKGSLILTAGGTGNHHHAHPHINIFFKMVGAYGHEEHTVYSVNTDTIPASKDNNALEDISKLAKWLEG